MSVSESSLPLARQATSATSLIFLLVALPGIGASAFTFVDYRETRRELDEMHRGGGGGGETG